MEGTPQQGLTTESRRVLSWLYHWQIRTELGLKVEQQASCPSGTAGDRPGRQENGCCLEKTTGSGEVY